MRDRIVDFLAQNGWPGWLVPGYWFLLCLSLVAGSILALSLWKRSGQDKQRASDLIFWGVPALFLGAKVLYCIQFGFPDRLDIWNTGGIALYGGFLGLMGAWLVQYMWRPYPILLFLDCVAPSLALGLFFTRIGCFLAGCNGGTLCSFPWGVRFPSNTTTFHNLVAAGLARPDQRLTPPVHPTQLYESLFGLIAFVVLSVLIRRRKKEGQVFFAGMISYGILRFFMEMLRSDTGGLHPFGVLTFAQTVSLAVILCSCALMFSGKLRALSLGTVPHRTGASLQRFE
jgi:phosphatidylglycerol---prolipoprotein diacylglyceryl transferase